MPDSKLDRYRAKRDPARTPEPVPGPEETGRSGSTSGRGRRPGPPARTPRTAPAGPRFVIQEHHARALHWDFRLERDGVLVSWALPKGLPTDPGQNHLAVPTEDHPLEYADFAGEIPAGEYGGGTVTIWDHGTYDCEKWRAGEVIVVLHGTRAEGRYALFSTARGSRGSGSGSRPQWMIHRMDPVPADWEPLPQLVRPMLCRIGDLPAEDDGWAYEFKWDGVRAVAYVDGGRVRLVSRNDRDVTVSYPEIRGLGEALGSRPAVLDGELVALDERGRPSFGQLQTRMHVADAARARRLVDTVPVTYLLFDVMHLDGHPTVDLPYDERRRLLESLALAGDHWATPPAFVDTPGSAVLDAARDQGLEGVVAKRRDGTYQPGRRSAQWLKVKVVATQEVVIGGTSPGRGRRSGAIGALLLGLPGPDGLAYVGKVGTGFTDAALEDLGRRLDPLRSATSPFTGRLPAAQVAGASWVRPELVGEVSFGEWTREGRLRHPVWRGLRPDKSPSEVLPER